MKTTDITNLARLYVGDLASVRYDDVVMSLAIQGAVLSVNADLDTNFSYTSSTREISPTPSNRGVAILARAMAYILVIGEENSAAIDGGGIMWKSGLSVINLGNHQKSLSSAAKGHKDEYDRLRIDYIISLGGGVSINLYDTNDTTTTGVN